MTRKWIIGVTGLLVLSFGVYWFAGQDAHDDERGGAPASSMKQTVQDLSSGKMKAKSASINSKELTIVHNDSSETVLDLPEDEFFVSIAPYIKETHPCAIHNLATCQGEMASQEFHVTIENPDGTVFLSRTMPSQPNGFIDLWLPRDQTFKVKITKDGRTAVSKLTTFDKDNTCISTMQLT